MTDEEEMEKLNAGLAAQGAAAQSSDPEPWEPGSHGIEPRGAGGEEQRGAVKETLKAMFGDAFARMQARGRGEEKMLPIPWLSLARRYRTGKIEGLDPLEVLRPGVHVLVGGTGSGKTQLALSIAYEAAKVGAPVTYVGLELDETGIISRLMGIDAASSKKIEGFEARWAERWSSLDWPGGETSKVALEKVGRAFADKLDGPLGNMRLRLGSGRDGFTADTFAQVLKEAKAGADTGRPALVVLDFLQLLGANPDDREDREIRTRIARASYAANNATLDGRLVVLLVSATARAAYETLDGADLDKLPFPGSLVGSGKESGEIEYSATSVLVMARLAEEQAATAPGCLGEGGWRNVRLVALAKGRHGGDGWTMLGFDGGALYDIDPDGDLLAAAATVAAKKSKGADQSKSKNGKGSGTGAALAGSGVSLVDGWKKL